MTRPRACDVPEAIQWHEGMMLAPQHFQQLALRQEGLLAYGLRSAAPFHWGLHRLRYDPAALGEDILRITEIEAVMPDGLTVLAGAGDIADLPLADAAQSSNGGSVMVYLTVPVRRTGSAADPETLQRFVSVNGPLIVDESTGSSELSIPRLRPRLGLTAVAAGERRPDDRFVSLPLVELSRNTGPLAPTDYHPPLLTLTRDWPIGQRCHELIRAVREKARFLAQRTAVGDGDTDRLTRLDLQSLLSGLPVFEAVVGADMCHPFTVYLALAGLTGPMASMATGALPPALQPYDHDDIKPSFDLLLAFAGRTLDQVRQDHIEHRFEFDGRRFWISLPPEFLTSRLTVGLRLPAGRREPDIVAWMEQALIGSESRLRTLTANRVLGAPRRRIDRDDEMGLLPPRDVVLFHVEADERAIRAGEPLFIWRSQDTLNAPRPSDVFLYVAAHGGVGDREATR